MQHIFLVTSLSIFQDRRMFMVVDGHGLGSFFERPGKRHKEFDYSLIFSTTYSLLLHSDIRKTCHKPELFCP